MAAGHQQIGALAEDLAQAERRYVATTLELDAAKQQTERQHAQAGEEGQRRGVDLRVEDASVERRATAGVSTPCGAAHGAARTARSQRFPVSAR